MEIQVFMCMVCGKEKKQKEGLAAPMCCGQSMVPKSAEPLPHPMTAEADRFEDEDEAFDDGVH